MIEAGVGTGILSFVAAACGAKVYGVEINRRTYELANEIKAVLIKKGFFKSEQIKFSLGDARTYNPNIAADLIISENLYTGMFYEKQIQIGNHLIKLLKPEGLAIPSGWQDFAFLAHSEFPCKPKPKEVFVPLALEGVWIPYTQLSPVIRYTNFDFQKINKETIDCSCVLPALEDGEINSLVVYSQVPMPSGYVIGRYDCIALNNDMVISLPILKIKKGEPINLQLRYNCGDDIKLSEIKAIRSDLPISFLTHSAVS